MSPAGPKEPPGGVVSGPAHGVTLPLDSYRASPGEQLVIDRARGALFRSCMARFGLTMPKRDPAPVIGDPNRERYMLADEQAARSRGYHPPPAEQAAARRAAEPRRLPPDYLAAASGRGAVRIRGVPVPSGGCAGEATRRLTLGGSAVAVQRVEELSAWSWDRAKRDQRVVAVFAAWSACMDESGYHYRTPMAANDDPAFRTGTPTAREIATATADVRCKRRVNLIGTWAAVEAAYQRQAIAQRRAELQAAKKTVTTQLSVAAQIVREG
jgi:hypothetical protein